MIGQKNEWMLTSTLILDGYVFMTISLHKVPSLTVEKWTVKVQCSVDSLH